MKTYEKIDRISNVELNTLNSMLNKPIDILMASWFKKGLGKTNEEIKTLTDIKVEHDTYLLKDSRAFVDTVLNFQSGRKIAWVGDYDMDGISSSAQGITTLQFLRNRSRKFREMLVLKNFIKSCENELLSYDELKLSYENFNIAKMIFKTVDRRAKAVEEKSIIVDLSEMDNYKKDMAKSEALLYETYVPTKAELKFLEKYDFDYDFLTYYIPDRVKDGYGISVKIVEMLYKNKVNTIITSDNGIAAIEAVERAKELGMEIYITDHHECQNVPAQGTLTINPQQKDCTYPFKGICGAQVVYKLCKELLKKACVPESDFIYSRIHQYATLGTIGDVMPLIDENRFFVKEGIEQMKKNPCKLIKYLSFYTNLPLSDLTSKEIAFSWVPTFNAVGRLSNAEKALEAFLTEDDEQLKCKVSTLIYINEKRKDIKKELIKKGKKLLDNSRKAVMLKYGKTYEGMMGIIAGNFSEETHKPTGAFSLAEDGVTSLGMKKYILKGSMRAPNGYDVFSTLQAMDEKGFPFLRYGGHKGAAGLSIPRDKWNQFIDMFDECIVQTSEVDSIKYLDANMFEIQELSKNIKEFGTFGQALPHPNVQINIHGNMTGFIESGHVKIGSVFLYNQLPEVQKDTEIMKIHSTPKQLIFTPVDGKKMFSMICQISSGNFSISGISYFLIEKNEVKDEYTDDLIFETEEEYLS